MGETIQMMKKQNNWFVYLLYNPITKRTYIGSTTNPWRRLRQHNGQIRGGARSTRGGNWNMVGFLEGFQNRSEACRWEKIIKSRCRGLKKRWNAFYDLWLGIQPPGKQYPLPSGIQSLYWNEEELNGR